MKHVHFFGCSFTAGDELANDEFFPWAKECTSAEEYYNARNPILSDKQIYQQYTDACKLLAYPNLLSSDEITTYNHARLGASVKECVFLLMQAFNSNQPIDQVFFQIPPYPREMVMGDSDVNSIQLATVGRADNNDRYSGYVKQKLVSHQFYHWATEDLMDIIAISHYVRSRNIPFHLINFTNELTSRTNFLPNFAKFLKKEIMQSIDIVDLSQILNPANKLAGYHFNLIEHKRIKEHLLPIIQAG
jgi:hypothetical protein